MSKKRTREASSVDVSLVEIYEDLAHEDEEVRLKAAHSLLKKHFLADNPEQCKTILKRLLRGLCSGRKAARLGFSVALTECLNQLLQQEGSITSSEVLDVLESSTIPDSNTSGQDERDHYFGRVFGADAIIKSNLLFTKSEQPQWLRLLDIICGISAKKPWLRQECGWILYSCVQQLAKLNNKQNFMISVAEKLVQHKLIRTPEGVAIWIAIQHQVDNGRLPKAVWRYDSPLAKKDLRTLAQVLKDARSDAKDETDYESQGSATWSAQLHFAWEVVLAELFHSSDAKKHVEFGDFWLAAVDEGLFAPSNSPERKHWGLQLLQKTLSSAPREHLSKCFTNNATVCLLQSLKGDNKYLQKGAQKALRTVQTRTRDDIGSALYLIPALLEATNFIDFDATTKTKTMESILGSVNTESITGLSDVLKKLLWQPGTLQEAEASKRRKAIAILQTKLLNHAVTLQNLDSPKHILEVWVTVLRRSDMEDTPSPAFSESTLLFIRQRLTAALEQILKLGGKGRLLALDCIESVKSWDLSADQEILNVLEAGWKRFRTYHKMVQSSVHKGQKRDHVTSKEQKPKDHHDGQDQSGTEGLALLYGMIIFQVYSDDMEAVSILEELIAFEEESVHSTKSKKFKLESADVLVDILLSFASKPSKFLRRVTLDIFETFASKVSRTGLEALVNVLQAKETKAGQEELFEADGDVIEDGGSDVSPDDADVEMLDSDVEVVDVEDASSDDGSSSSSDQDSDSDSESDSSSTNRSDTDTESSTSESASDELAALERSLADALGTRKLTTDDLGDDNSSSDLDSDMDDDQMLTLDEKLSEVFRTRAAAQSQSKSKQKENKAARENVTNFKNRVLDIIDVYLKHQARNSNALDLLLPLLTLVRQTTVKQLATRAIDIIKAFCTRCKGLHNIPILDRAHSSQANGKNTIGNDDRGDEGRTTRYENDPAWAMDILSGIHDEVCLPSSNAHKNACNQSSILLAKTLILNGVGIEAVIGIYAKTQARMMTDDKVTVQEGFFRDWIGWCGSVRGKLGQN